LEFKGVRTTAEGIEARSAMETRRAGAENTRNRIIRDLIDTAKVFKGGGAEVHGLDLIEKVKSAAEDSLDRLFPQFREGDDAHWNSVINRAKNKDGNALQAVGHNDNPEKHPVSVAILSALGSGKKGREIREQFENTPYGWPRDAIDAVLITLHTSGHLRAVHKGTVLTAGQLDQAKIPVTDFRSETVAIDVKGRIKLRRLFQDAEISCKADEESAAAEKFLDKLENLAAKAGGDPPLSARPKIATFESMRALAGNELLAAMLKEHDELKELLAGWQQRAKLAEIRLPAWRTLEQFLEHATGVPEAATLRAEANAVRNERRLLDESDPVPAIHAQLVKLLRGAVKKAHTATREVFQREFESLEASANWQRLRSEDRIQLLEDAGVVSPADLSVGDDASLLAELSARPLAVWATTADALPERFRQVALATARLLEPKTQRVSLRSATLKTAEDVAAWLAKTEAELLSKINDGPVIIN
jgi:hypothetical protein